MNKSNRPADPPAAEKCENCERLKDVLHRDRSGLADGIDRIRKLVKGWWWVPLGEWACYDYTERTAETMRTEFSNCLRQIEDVALSTMKASGNLAHAECCGRRPPTPEPADRAAKCPVCPKCLSDVCDCEFAATEKCGKCKGDGKQRDSLGRIGDCECNTCGGSGYRPPTPEPAESECGNCGRPLDESHPFFKCPYPPEPAESERKACPRCGRGICAGCNHWRDDEETLETN